MQIDNKKEKTQLLGTSLNPTNQSFQFEPYIYNECRQNDLGRSLLIYKENKSI